NDHCGNTSSSLMDICPLQLTATLNADNSIELNWTEYVGWQDGVANYTLDVYTMENLLLSTIDLSNETSYTYAADDPENQIYIFVITASPIDPTIHPAVSNRITIIKDPNIAYPTAFTPNGDSLNNIFNVFGRYINTFAMKIFNR